MIDFFDDIFFKIEETAKQAEPSVSVVEEYNDLVDKFPRVTVEETANSTTNMDSSQREKFANVGYRLRVYSNDPAGKKLQAKSIFQSIDQMLISSNFSRRSKSVKPELYHSSVYEIVATYEATIGENGQVYTRR